MSDPPHNGAVKLVSGFVTNLGIGLILAALLVPLVGRYAYGGPPRGGWHCLRSSWDG
jgi:hypothetical protein